MKLICLVYPFLFGLSLILTLWYKNIAEVSLNKIKKVLGFYLIVYLLTYVIVLSVAKTVFIQDYFLKTSFIVFMFILIFFNTKKIVDKILSAKIHTRMINVCFLILFFIPVLGVNILPLKIISKIIFCVVFFISFSLIMQIVLFLQEAKKSCSNAEHKVKIIKGERVKEKNLPDIYYIVPDAYAGFESLKENLKFDNWEFENFLMEKGFKIFENPKSNYSLTNLSITSTLNIEYIQDFFENDKVTDEFQNRLNLAKFQFNSFIKKYFQNKGYKWIHILNFWEKQFLFDDYENVTDKVIDTVESYEFEKILLKNTLFDYFVTKFMEASDIKNSLNTFEALKTVAKTEPAGKFVYSHLLCPHEPYCFDKNGNKPDKNLKKTNKQDAIKLYLGQLEYLNKQLKQIINDILKYNKNSIIIIQSDHGSDFNLKKEKDFDKWEEKLTEKSINERFNIIRAVYMPERFKIDCEFESSVNLFRMILNSCFGENFNKLEDKKYFACYKNYFSFKEV